MRARPLSQGAVKDAAESGTRRPSQGDRATVPIGAQAQPKEAMPWPTRLMTTPTTGASWLASPMRSTCTVAARSRPTATGPRRPSIERPARRPFRSGSAESILSVCVRHPVVRRRGDTQPPSPPERGGAFSRPLGTAERISSLDDACGERRHECVVNLAGLGSP